MKRGFAFVGMQGKRCWQQTCKYGSEGEILYTIVHAEFIAPEIKRIIIQAPRIARRRKAGQFVIVRTHERGERIPLTIVDSDVKEGTITLIVQGVGKSTREMNMLCSGESIQDVVGPLGQPSIIENFGVAVVVGGGVGTAIAYPIAVALKEAGNRVLAITGGRTREVVILEKELREISDRLYVTTDDGSYGEQGLVTQPLEREI